MDGEIRKILFFYDIDRDHFHYRVEFSVQNIAFQSFVSNFVCCLTKL